MSLDRTARRRRKGRDGYSHGESSGSPPRGCRQRTQSEQGTQRLGSSCRDVTVEAVKAQRGFKAVPRPQGLPGLSACESQVQIPGPSSAICVEYRLCVMSWETAQGPSCGGEEDPKKSPRKRTQTRRSRGTSLSAQLRPTKPRPPKQAASARRQRKGQRGLGMKTTSKSAPCKKSESQQNKHKRTHDCVLLLQHCKYLHKTKDDAKQ